MGEAEVSVTGACEARLVAIRAIPHPAATTARCGQPGMLMKSALKPFGVFMCDEHEKVWKTRRTTG